MQPHQFSQGPNHLALFWALLSSTTAFSSPTAAYVDLQNHPDEAQEPIAECHFEEVSDLFGANDTGCSFWLFYP
jgi:hypothetical protein